MWESIDYIFLFNRQRKPRSSQWKWDYSISNIQFKSNENVSTYKRDDLLVLCLPHRKFFGKETRLGLLHIYLADVYKWQNTSSFFLCLGIKSVVVGLLTQKAEIKYDFDFISPEEIASQVSMLGFESQVMPSDEEKAELNLLVRHKNGLEDIANFELANSERESLVSASDKRHYPRFMRVIDWVEIEEYEWDPRDFSFP